MKIGKMTDHAIADELAALPAEARREAIDFIVFLRQRHGRSTQRRPNGKCPLKHEPFLGIWAERTDMNDSVQWVRETRKREWSR